MRMMSDPTTAFETTEIIGKNGWREKETKKGDIDCWPEAAKSPSAFGDCDPAQTAPAVRTFLPGNRWLMSLPLIVCLRDPGLLVEFRIDLSAMTWETLPAKYGKSNDTRRIPGPPLFRVLCGGIRS
jgi:hypothetical protein